MKLPLSDLESILSRTQPLWEELRGQRIFITGGTGFFGKWLLESFLYANTILKLNATAVALTRDPQKFKNTSLHLTDNSAIELYPGDVATFEYPKGDFKFVILGAGAGNRRDSVMDINRTIQYGTLRTLQFAREHGTKRALFISSGAVRGINPAHVPSVAENSLDFGLSHETRQGLTAQQVANRFYGFAKMYAEQSCILYSQYFPCSIARCFSFTGPHLPLNDYAIGNFIRDGLQGGQIIVRGDGTPLRSYMYMSDLTVWLWTILFKGASGQTYDVGSEDAISISDLAHLVAQQFTPVPPVIIEKPSTPGEPAERYIPYTDVARGKLQLKIETPLVDAIRKTIDWYRGVTPIFNS